LHRKGIILGLLAQCLLKANGKNIKGRVVYTTLLMALRRAFYTFALPWLDYKDRPTFMLTM
jgi:hypothetical protein